jgi:hypothetical protein
MKHLYKSEESDAEEEHCVIYALLGSYGAWSGNFIRTFRDIPRSHRQRLPMKMGPIGCPETSVQNYHPTLRKTQKSADLIYIAAEAWNHMDHVDEDYNERKQSEQWNAKDVYCSYNWELQQSKGI